LLLRGKVIIISHKQILFCFIKTDGSFAKQKYETLIFPVCCLSILHSFKQSNKKSDYKEALRLIDVWLSGQRDFDKLTGISVAIVNNQNIIFMAQ